MPIHAMTCFGAGAGAGNPVLVIEDGPLDPAERQALARERNTTCVFIGGAAARAGIGRHVDAAGGVGRQSQAAGRSGGRGHAVRPRAGPGRDRGLVLHQGRAGGRDCLIRTRLEEGAVLVGGTVMEKP
ncbi:hypothetical protein [Massilia forsythiae]|uniref:hypothetical protein n=1 Tax=Massilia forsythiae TaxID=2728020 RepID=UPI001E410266|nr:hypothetical protein [Massilia forsythiae]